MGESSSPFVEAVMTKKIQTRDISPRQDVETISEELPLKKGGTK